MKKIQYSVAMMHSNPTDKNSEKKAIAKLQLTGIVGIEEMAEHITEHNSVFSRGTIVGVLAELGSCIREFILQGYKVKLSTLGSFAPSVSSTGADTLDAFTAQNITSMRAIFSPGSDLLNLRAKAEFEKTSPRRAQAATLAAVMAGKDTVDLTKDATSDSGSGNGGNGGNGDNGEVTE